MKYILTSVFEGYPEQKIEGLTKEEKEYFESFGGKIEKVIRYYRRTATAEIIKKKFGETGYKNDGKGGCYKEVENYAFVVDLEGSEILKLSEKCGYPVIVSTPEEFNLPTLEIYDTYRE